MTYPSAHETLPVVSLLDAALDATKMDLAEYARTRDPALVVERPDAKATWFHLRPVDSLTFQMLVQSVSGREAEKRTRAFQLAVSKVEHLVTVSGTKHVAYVPTDEQRLYGHTYKTLSDAQLGDFAPAYIDEVGEVAYRRGFFPGGRVDTLPALPLWLSICRARYVQAAASLETSSASEAPKPKPPEAEAPEPTGDEDIPVTVEAG